MQGHLSWAHIHHLLLSWGMMDPEYSNPMIQKEIKQKNGTLLWQWFKKKIAVTKFRAESNPISMCYPCVHPPKEVSGRMKVPLC